MGQSKNKTSTTKNNLNAQPLVFKKINYQLMILAIVIVAIGFFLMAGDTDIYSFTKITVAPFVVVFGFGVGVVSILFKSKSNQ